MFQKDIFDEDQNSTWHAESTDNYFIVTERYSDNTERVALVLKKDITHLYSPTDATGIRLSYSKWSGDELTLMPDLSPEKHAEWLMSLRMKSAAGRVPRSYFPR